MRFRKPTHGKLRLTGTAIDVAVILLAVWMAFTATQRSTVVINCRKQRLHSKCLPLFECNGDNEMVRRRVS
jgi:hypothetical protein